MAEEKQTGFAPIGKNEDKISIQTTTRNLEALLGKQPLCTGHVVKAGAGFTGMIRIVKKDETHFKEGETQFNAKPGELYLGEKAINEFIEKGRLTTEYVSDGKTYIVELVNPPYRLDG